MIKHAAWPTPAPPVCTTLLDQQSWDKFADRYRPAGYHGNRYDSKAYQIWTVQQLFIEAHDEDPIANARIAQACRTAEVCKKSNRGRYCELGTCFVCTVAQYLDEAVARCEHCGERIDPDTCWCGEPFDGHPAASNHNFIPMGCKCYMEKP